MIKQLVKFANHLDSLGLTIEADEIDSIVNELAKQASWGDEDEGGPMLYEERRPGGMGARERLYEGTSFRETGGESAGDENKFLKQCYLKGRKACSSFGTERGMDLSKEEIADKIPFTLKSRRNFTKACEIAFVRGWKDCAKGIASPF